MQPLFISLAVLLSIAAPVQPNNGDALERGYAAMYNLNFPKAHQDFADWAKLHPADPMGPVSDAAAYLFAEFERLQILQSEFLTEDDNFTDKKQKLKPDRATKFKFNAALNKGQRLADRILTKSPDDRNALLASVLARGLNADYLALIEKSNLSALSEMKQGRAMAQHLLQVDPECYDAYLAVGAENYILSQKSAPLRWVLRVSGAETDKAAGIENLRITAEKGHYLLPYAKLLLAVASLRDGNLAAARSELSWLAQHYPSNRLYREELQRLK